MFNGIFIHCLEQGWVDYVVLEDDSIGYTLEFYEDGSTQGYPLYGTGPR